MTIDDGVNASPPILVRVISLSYDGSPRDRLPDPWQATYAVTGAANDSDGAHSAFSRTEERMATGEPVHP